MKTPRALSVAMARNNEFSKITGCQTSTTKITGGRKPRQDLSMYPMLISTTHDPPTHLPSTGIAGVGHQTRLPIMFFFFCEFLCAMGQIQGFVNVRQALYQ
jgi:hypothetical protein